MTNLERLLGLLQVFYGKLPEPPRDPFRLFVWEVLSVHATPRKRDLALAALKRIPAFTPDAMWKAPQKKLQESVLLAGPYLEQRLSALRTGVEIFRRTPSLPAAIRGPLPGARRALRGLPQMGEGGAYRMLLFAADHPVLPVDARVSRVARRLGYGKAQADFSKSARSVRDAIARELPASVEVYRRAFLYLAHHGAATCAESEPHCTVCPLLKDCPEGQARTLHHRGYGGTRGVLGRRCSISQSIFRYRVADGPSRSGAAGIGRGLRPARREGALRLAALPVPRRLLAHPNTTRSR